MNKYNNIAKDVNEEVESCNRCGKVFKNKSIIFAAYGLLFCSTDCIQEKFPDADLNAAETILASDIGVK